MIAPESAGCVPICMKGEKNMERDMSWIERFMESQETRKAGAGVPKEAIPFGPPLDQRTDLHRPAYWVTDISDHPNAVFDIVYTIKAPHPDQKMHLLYPEGFDPAGDAPLPLLIFVHGGGFEGGNSEGHKVLYTAEASLHALRFGYAVALVDYRLRPRFEIIDCIHDVKAAIRYLRANADQLGLDEKRFALTGESAGGYLVNICGVTGDRPEFEDYEMGNPGVSTRVSTVISWYSLYDVNEDMIRRFFYTDADKRFPPEVISAVAAFYSPATYLDKNTPSFLLQHGTKDSEVDCHNSVHMHEDMVRLVGADKTCLELVEGADHGVRWFITRQNGERMARWLREKMG